MKKLLFLTSLLFIAVSLFATGGLLYPTADVAPQGRITFSLGFPHLGIGVGMGGNIEIGEYLSYSTMGAYLKMKPLQDLALEVSYLPFNFFGFNRLLNVLGVYRFENNAFNINVGVRGMMINNIENSGIEAFGVVKKKISDGNIIFEGGLGRDLGNTSINPNLNIGVGAEERFWIFNIKGGIFWINVLSNNAIFHPIPYIEVEMIWDLWR